MARYDIPSSEYGIADARIEIGAARFNDDIVSRLLEAALDALAAHRLCRDEIPVARVPGAFELPLAARWIAERGEAEAIIALGAVIRGDTPHFGHVCTQTARGLQDVSLRHGVPVTFGVLTCNDWDQADSRCPGPRDEFHIECANVTGELHDLLLRIREWESGKHQVEEAEFGLLRNRLDHCMGSCEELSKKYGLPDHEMDALVRQIPLSELDRSYRVNTQGNRFELPVNEIGRRIERFTKRLAELQANLRARRIKHNKGYQAALAALEMVSLRRRLGA